MGKDTDGWTRTAGAVASLAEGDRVPQDDVNRCLWLRNHIWYYPGSLSGSRWANDQTHLGIIICVHANIAQGVPCPSGPGWVDLGWWAATVATYCQSRVVEHPKSKSTKPSPRGHGTPCTEAAPTRRLLLFFASRLRRKLIKTLPLCSGISWQFFCPRGEGGMATASRRHRMSRSPFE